MKNKINHQNHGKCFIYYDKKALYNKLVIFIGRKMLKTQKWTDHIRRSHRNFFALKAASVEPPKASLSAMDIMKFTGDIYGGVLVKDYAVYKKWINE